ncbi:MAG: DUF3667 domain-containing protein [Rhodothermales bacterium]|nr:DUF3667 domain-containing protein [Rhodothermales bacterium]MBO6778423.1 DUF3667 domain-containing protein [Rhodothermales bacterium]
MEPLRDMFEDAVDALFSLDNRLLRSLGALLARPGLLTVEYLEGRRQPYLSAIRLYLWLSVAYFVIAELLGVTDLMFVTSTSGTDLARLLPRFMFVIVPISGLIMFLLQRKERPHYVEHLVHALHLHAAWYVYFAVSALAAAPIEDPSDLAALLWWQWPLAAVGVGTRVATLVHTYLSFKRVGGRGRLRAFLETLTFFLIYLTVLGAAIFGWMMVVARGG